MYRVLVQPYGGRGAFIYSRHLSHFDYQQTRENQSRPMCTFCCNALHASFCVVTCLSVTVASRYLQGETTNLNAPEPNTAPLKARRSGVRRSALLDPPLDGLNPPLDRRGCQSWQRERPDR